MSNETKIILSLIAFLLLYPKISNAQVIHTDVLACVPNGPVPANATACPDQAFGRNYSCLQSATIGGYCPGINWAVPWRTLVVSCTPGIYGQYVCNPGYNLDGGGCWRTPQCASSGPQCSLPAAGARCINGNPSNTDQWTWNCISFGGTISIPCSATQAPTVVGICGPYNGRTFLSTPTGNNSDFCSAGIFGGLMGTGPWTWICSDICGPSFASCSTPIKKGWKEIAP